MSADRGPDADEYGDGNEDRYRHIVNRLRDFVDFDIKPDGPGDAERHWKALLAAVAAAHLLPDVGALGRYGGRRWRVCHRPSYSQRPPESGW